MDYTAGEGLANSFEPYSALREGFGFVPNVFREQAPLPRLVESQAALTAAILFRGQALSRIQKECILLALATARGNAYCVTWHYHVLLLLGVTEEMLHRILADYRQAGLQPANRKLLDFAVKLGLGGPSVSRDDVAALVAGGLTGDAILEAVLVTALGDFLCTLAFGLAVAPDFPPLPIAPQAPPATLAADGGGGGSGPFLPLAEAIPEDLPVFGLLREQFGFVPAVFRAQLARPDVVAAEAGLLQALLASPGALTAGAPKLAEHPTREQILEAAATTALTCFLSTLHFGLGLAPDFPLRRTFPTVEEKKAHLSSPDLRQTAVAVPADPDAECVARVRSGDLDVFEVLMNRHSQRVYRTLIGILGNADDACDAMQDTFLRAFQHLGDFEGRSKLSTWLVSIASNTAIQRLRDRKPTESLDESESDEGFRPRQVQAWTDDPEQLCSKAEMRSLIESSVLRLPAKYRLALMLRDIEQVPIEEAAAALGLGIPAMKARVLRGRLMLREALSGHFAGARLKGNVKGVAI